MSLIMTKIIMLMEESDDTLLIDLPNTFYYIHTEIYAPKSIEIKLVSSR